MSLISKALKKIQESRTSRTVNIRKIVDIVYLTDTPKQGIKNVLIGHYCYQHDSDNFDQRGSHYDDHEEL